jgi:putative membrane protein
MDRLKTLLRGALATSAIFCLVSLGATAQDQATTSGSQSSTSGTQSTTKSKKSHKSSKSSDASMGASDSSSTSSSSGASSSGQLSAADKTFVMKAAQGGMAEVELGQLATQNAKSDEVKQFGQRMVDDHTKANDQLKQVAQQKGVAIPTELSAKDKADKARLSKLNGEQFDRAYMQHMVMDHKKDVAEFQKESTSGKDNDVKNFASQTLPTLQDHLKQAQQVSKAEASPAHAKKSSTSASANPKQ